MPATAKKRSLIPRKCVVVQHRNHLLPRKFTKRRHRLILPDTAETRRAEKEVKQAIATACRKLTRATGLVMNLDTDDSLVWFQHTDNTAGLVHPEQYGNRIFLNWRLYKANRRLFLREIIPHEVAHLYQFVVDEKDRPHGHCWLELMKAIKLQPKVRVAFRDSKKVAAAPVFIYECACLVHTLSEKQHREQQKRNNHYCRCCGKKLKFRYESFGRIKKVPQKR